MESNYTSLLFWVTKGLDLPSTKQKAKDAAHQ